MKKRLIILLAICLALFAYQAQAAENKLFVFSADMKSEDEPVATLINGKCSICVNENRKSSVARGWCMSTLMSCGNGYYDEDGAYHAPKPCNTTTCNHACSNGHTIVESFPSY